LKVPSYNWIDNVPFNAVPPVTATVAVSFGTHVWPLDIDVESCTVKHSVVLVEAAAGSEDPL
jgi:hypothetical protein